MLFRSLYLEESLIEFYKDNVTLQYKNGAVPGMTKEPSVPEELVKKAALHTQTAIVTICRFSGEGWDRKSETEELSQEIQRDVNLNVRAHKPQLSEPFFDKAVGVPRHAVMSLIVHTKHQKRVFAYNRDYFARYARHKTTA